MALILVTGSSTGLGQNTAKALADAGHDVRRLVRANSRTPMRLSRRLIARDVHQGREQRIMKMDRAIRFARLAA